MYLYALVFCFWLWLPMHDRCQRQLVLVLFGLARAAAGSVLLFCPSGSSAQAAVLRRHSHRELVAQPHTDEDVDAVSCAVCV